MYLVFVLIVFLSYLIIQIGQIDKEKKQTWFSLCAFLVILFLHFFKDDSILPDLDRNGGGYKYEFEFISELDSFKDFLVAYFVTGGYFHEIGWSLFNFIISRFTDDFSIFQKIVSFGICAGYSYGVYKLSKSPLFSFLFIMLYPTALFQSFYVLRQHLATSLFFFFVPSIIKNDYKWIILGFTIAISLHYSAVILLPFYFFYRLGNNLFSFKRIVVSIVLVGSFYFMLNNMTYARYADKAIDEKSNALGFILTGGVFIVFIISEILHNKIRKVVDKYEIYIKTYMLYSVLICFACLGTDTGRLTNYFTIFLSISVPYCVSNFGKPLRLGTYAVFIVYCIISAYDSNRSIFQYQLIF